MPEPESAPVAIAFVGHASSEAAARVRAYEDEVLALLADHGARVIGRGHRRRGEAPELPVEVQLLWFPHREAFDSYLADPRRAAAIERHGDPFDSKTVIEVDLIEEPPR